jgi:hypothetical protein
MATYDYRLATRVTSAVALRLRQTALLRAMPLSHLLTEVLDKGLPSGMELAGQLHAQISEGDAR